MKAQIKKPRKEIIFETAARLFRDKGYAAASMRTLANEVGLKPSSFYSHFDSKEQILQKICFDIAHHFTREIEKIDQSDLSPSQKIKAIIELHVNTAIADNASVLVFNDEWRHMQPPFLEKFLELRKAYEQRILAILEKAMRDGTLKSINSYVALHTILSSVRWIYQWYKPERAISSEQLAGDISSLILDGLRA